MLPGHRELPALQALAQVRHHSAHLATTAPWRSHLGLQEHLEHLEHPVRPRLDQLFLQVRRLDRHLVQRLDRQMLPLQRDMQRDTQRERRELRPLRCSLPADI